MPNDEAVKILETIDILALPTYYPWEAFPISILEAMSRGKMVISTDRAAIPDILTDLDGNKCGCIVGERSPEQIYNAIKWCQNHKEEADTMCRKAYEKVKNSYDTAIIYRLYKDLYDQLTTNARMK
jgi:glycosyltransferase involved in cell wall biosynthesis